MPEDFQALPPVPPPLAADSPDYGFGELNLRKSEKVRSGWRLVALGLLGAFIAIAIVVFVESTKPRPPMTFKEVGFALEGTWVASDGKMTVTFVVEPGGERGDFTMDLPTAEKLRGRFAKYPRTNSIDFMLGDGSRISAIYSIDATTLKLCWYLNDAKRPTDFTAGSGRTLLVLERSLRDDNPR
jgi:hypothetical protein